MRHRPDARRAVRWPPDPCGLVETALGVSERGLPEGQFHRIGGRSTGTGPGDATATAILRTFRDRIRAYRRGGRRQSRRRLAHRTRRIHRDDRSAPGRATGTDHRSGYRRGPPRPAPVHHQPGRRQPRAGRRPVAHRVHRSVRRSRPARSGRRPPRRRRERLARSATPGLAGRDPHRINRYVRTVPCRGQTIPAPRPALRGPVPPGPTRQQDAHQRAMAHRTSQMRPPGPQRRPANTASNGS